MAKQPQSTYSGYTGTLTSNTKMMNFKEQYLHMLIAFPWLKLMNSSKVKSLRAKLGRENVNGFMLANTNVKAPTLLIAILYLNVASTNT